MIEKEIVRKQIKKKRQTLTKEQVLKKSKKIESLLFKTIQYQEAKTIYLYYNMEKEVITKSMILHALSLGKKVALPKIEDNKMDFYYINDISQVSIGYFNIMEPVTKEIAKDNEALMILPGIAFDKERNRLGYGRGFYDRYLGQAKKQRRKIEKIGLCFGFQLIKKVPTEEYDIPVDSIITPEEVV